MISAGVSANMPPYQQPAGHDKRLGAVAEPADQSEVIGLAARATMAEAEEAVAAACAAQRDWGAARQPTRDVGRAAGPARLRDRPAFMALEIIEAGKSWSGPTPTSSKRSTSAILRVGNAPAGRRRTNPARPGETSFQHWLPRGSPPGTFRWPFSRAWLPPPWSPETRSS
jgi:acyl-CoA reductase-like NAD-dependent aldehyde dehydrogenase